MKPPHIGIEPLTFRRLAAQMRSRWSLAMAAVDARGVVVLSAGREAAQSLGTQAQRRLALEEALRWGEPTVQLAGGRILWAMPLMHNARLLGGIVAGAPEREVFPDGTGKAAFDVRRACEELRRLVEEANLANAALLAQRREEYRREQKRAEAIHEFKLQEHYNIRELYLRDEPELVAAVRRSDRAAAREILNRLLVSIHHHAGDRVDLIKSFFMELVATMCRTAVEAGGAPEELLGANFASISELAQLPSLERLAPWLHDMLERVMDSIHRHRGRTNSMLLTAALDYIAENYAREISRDDAAKVAHLSPSHFSRLLRRQTGRSFTDLLNLSRVGKAAELLRRSDMPLAAIALETGFRDQSYFTKVFRRYMKMTPGEYRRSTRQV